MKTIGIAIITHQSKKHLPHCLPPLLNSPLKPRVLVVNSSSGDGTVELAREMGAETLIIPRAEFNHGTTREKARLFLQTDIVGMLTPDAYFVDQFMLEKLLQPILQDQAAVAYAKQIPHKGSGFFESFPREYNYPDHSHIRSIADLSKYGIYTYFCSNSCAAYANKTLDEVGGFPAVLLGEDTVVVAKLLNKGYKIAYVAEALIHHSHRYSLKEEFQRNFDTGLARKSYADLLSSKGGDTQRGIDYLKVMISYLFKEKPHFIPYALSHIGAKWLGYKVGRMSVKAPTWWKKFLSSQDFYW